MKKSILKIDLTIDENENMSGGVHIEGEMSSIAAALVFVSHKSPVLYEAIKIAAELNRRLNHESTE